MKKNKTRQAAIRIYLNKTSPGMFISFYPIQRKYLNSENRLIKKLPLSKGSKRFLKILNSIEEMIGPDHIDVVYKLLDEIANAFYTAFTEGKIPANKK